MTTRNVLDRPWAIWRTDVRHPFILATFRDRVWADATAGAMNEDVHEEGQPRPTIFEVRPRFDNASPLPGI